jgi:hypothetical protein
VIERVLRAYIGTIPDDQLICVPLCPEVRNSGAPRRSLIIALLENDRKS